MKNITLGLTTFLIFILLLAACSDPEPTPFPVTETPPTEAEPTDIPATTPPLDEVATQVPPTELPPTMTPLPTPTAVPVSPIESMNHTPDPQLTNTTWVWYNRDPNGNQMDEIVVPNPENYTILFNDNGSLQAKLDCNESNGRYATENNSSIFMELGATTLAYCGDDSLDGSMAMMFGPAQSYNIEISNDILALEWVAGGPIDYFQKANAALPDEMLNKTWQWNKLGSQILDVTVEEPEKYLIQFQDDGTVDLQADCNLLQGTYTTTANAKINIDLSPANAATTLAECPDGALYELYLLALDTTEAFTLLDGDLVLLVGGDHQNHDAVMYFSEEGTELPEPDEESNESEATQPTQPAPDTGDGTGTVNAPDGVNMRIGPGSAYPVVGIIADGTVLTIVGVSQDREWWVVENPEAPEEQVWVSRNFVETNMVARDVPTIADPEIEPTLLDNPWQWVSLTTPVESTTVNDPSLYTIQFNADGSAAIRADCNTTSASYTTDENAININMGATTLVACPEGSLDALYLNTLTNVTTYFFEARDLYLELPADGGTMKFTSTIISVPEESEEETPEEPETPPAETEGDLFQIVSFGPAGSEQDVLAGTEISAIFTDTTIKGNAGCNDYSGTLSRTDDSFKVSDLIVTEKACAEAAGIMEQEQAYLAALANVGAFSWEERLSDDGSKIITVGQLFYVTGGNGIINLITP